MSRHRNVRNYAYEDDMSDDVYGHSVEEHDMCVSPSTAYQFMYNRNNEDQKRNLYGNYMETRFGSVEEQVEEEEQSEEEDHLTHSQDYKRPQLDPVSQAKLSSCLDQLQSILGDDCHEPTAVEAIIKFDFNAEKALDYIFNKESSKASGKQQSKKADSSLCCNMSDKANLNNQSTTTPRSLATAHATITQQQHYENTELIGFNLMSMSLNALVKEDQTTKNLSSFSILQESQNKNSPVLSHDPLLASSLKSLTAEGILSKTKPNAMFENELMSTSLSSLASLSITSVMPECEISNASKSVKSSLENDLMGLSLSSLANQASNKSPARLPDLSTSENVPENALFTTSLSSLASQDSGVGFSGLSSSLKTSYLPETSLVTASLSSLPDTSCQSGSLPFDNLMTTSLSSLASLDVNKDSSLMSSSLFNNSKPDSMSTTLSKLSIESSHVSNLSLDSLSGQTLSSLTGEGANQQFLETSLSSLSISSVPQKQMENAGSVESNACKEPSIGEISLQSQVNKSKLHKKTEKRRNLDRVQKSVGPSKGTQVIKSKKHKILRSNCNPSIFACTLCYSVKRKAHLKSLPKRLCPVIGYKEYGGIVPFDFLTPSPDDTIQMKQKQRFYSYPY